MTDNHSYRFLSTEAVGSCAEHYRALPMHFRSRCTGKPVLASGSPITPGSAPIRSHLVDSYIIYLNLSSPIDLHDSLCHLSPVENLYARPILLRFVPLCRLASSSSSSSAGAAAGKRNARVILDIMRALPERTRLLLRNHDACSAAFYDSNPPRG